LEAAEKLAAENITAQVVSMPCWKLFEMQVKNIRILFSRPALRQGLELKPVSSKAGISGSAIKASLSGCPRMVHQRLQRSALRNSALQSKRQ
jgi:hypothetical protein